MFRWQFANVEVLLLCRHWRIAIATERDTVLGKLRHPDVEFLKVLLAIQGKLKNDGVPFGYEPILKAWKEYRRAKSGEPGVKAILNFTEKYQRFVSLITARGELERAWVDVSSVLSSDETIDSLEGLSGECDGEDDERPSPAGDTLCSSSRV